MTAPAKTTTTGNPLAAKYGKRVADTLTFLCGHVTVWEQREQVDALAVYLHTTVPDDSRANLKQYRDFSGAVRAASLLLRTRRAETNTVHFGHEPYSPNAATRPKLWQCPECKSLVDDEPADRCTDCQGTSTGAAEPQASGDGGSPAPPLGAAFQGEPRWVPWDGRSTTVRLAVPPAAEVAPDFPPAREGQWLRDINAELGTGAAHNEDTRTSAVAPGTPGPGPGHAAAEKAPGSAEPPATVPPASVDTSAGPGAPPETRTGDEAEPGKPDPLKVGNWHEPGDGKDGAQS